MKCCHRCQPLLEMMDELYSTRIRQWLYIVSKYKYASVTENRKDQTHVAGDNYVILQESLIYIWSRRHDFEWRTIEATDALIRKIIMYVSMKTYRGLNPDSTVELMYEKIKLQQYRADESDYYLYAKQLMQVLKTYKPTYPIYFELKYIQGMSYDEIMQHMNLKSRSTVYNNYSEIRKILKHELAVE